MNVDLSRVQRILEWVKTQIYLDETSINSKPRLVKRGQVYRCNFGCGIGSEMQKDRPAVVIQNNPNNKSSGNTIVIPITHDSSKMSCIAPITTQYNPNGDVILDGQANTSNLTCVSKARLGNYICDLPASDMKLIDEALAKTVDLMKYYANIKSKFEDKLQYIEKIREVRNAAQDELSTIRTELGISNDISIIDTIKALKAESK
ncbi:MAG: type II toxin-antitoxin system PemK/MazF family toxin [Lachnospiraceae bacterium]|nr:type II toxin-antitoxin system PemK/MazF family toxin [Lachnospiraceae bacterium]